MVIGYALFCVLALWADSPSPDLDLESVSSRYFLMPDQISRVHFETKSQPTNTKGLFWIKWQTNTLGTNPVAYIVWKNFTNVVNLQVPIAETVLSNMSNHVNGLADSGVICNIKGHSWKGHMHTTLEYSVGKIGCRVCNVCGQHQNLFEDWK